MTGDISIDFGSALPYLEQRILSLFGKDAESADWRVRLKNMIRLSAEQASHVRCVGMHTPIQIGAIYQPMRLTRSEDKKVVEVDARDLVEHHVDAVILAGPGRGKTTLLKYLYSTLASDSNSTPVLFTLRWDGVANDLTEFVTRLSRTKTVDRPVTLLTVFLENAKRQNVKPSRSRSSATC